MLSSLSSSSLDIVIGDDEAVDGLSGKKKRKEN